MVGRFYQFVDGLGAPSWMPGARMALAEENKERKKSLRPESNLSGNGTLPASACSAQKEKSHQEGRGNSGRVQPESRGRRHRAGERVYRALPTGALFRPERFFRRAKQNGSDLIAATAMKPLIFPLLLSLDADWLALVAFNLRCETVCWTFLGVRSKLNSFLRCNKCQSCYRPLL